MKRVQKTYSLARKLMAEITGLLYDLRELLTVYRGNLIALVIGIAIPIFNMHRNNPGMFSSYKKYYMKIFIRDIKLLNKNFFYIFRHTSGLEGSTIALGVVSCVLLISCLSTCLCLFKKCGELYRLRHPDEFSQKIKVSDEEIGELQEIDVQETSIINPPQEENVRNRNIDTISHSISLRASLPDVNEAGQVVWP